MENEIRPTPPQGEPRRRLEALTVRLRLPAMKTTQHIFEMFCLQSRLKHERFLVRVECPN